MEFRRLHRELDLAVRDACGGTTFPLDHDFHEIETLAENDQGRHTVSAATRHEFLRRLLAVNHARAEAEKTESRPTTQKRGKKVVSRFDEHVGMVERWLAEITEKRIRRGSFTSE